MSNNYRAIGLMSGTSVDGLDIAYCEFSLEEKWNYVIRQAETIPYNVAWKERLIHVTELSAAQLTLADVELGRLFGKLTSDFINKHGLHPDLIASHGHTVFHQPEKGFTLQIGNGYEIMKACRSTVVNDFRSLDVALGGQGAPLVPVGDQKLFHEYDFCLNLGGISNISFDRHNRRIAYDIAAHNLVLNRLAKRLGHEFDPFGKLAGGGKVNPALMTQLNELDYYKKPVPKSLGIEYIREKVFPVIDDDPAPVIDKLCSFNHHVASQIDKAVRTAMTAGRRARLLVTGGGAYNHFFIDLLKARSKDAYTVEIPDDHIINFKEALIFAFLGVLRIRKEINVFASATGASSDSCAGIVFDHLF